MKNTFLRISVIFLTLSLLLSSSLISCKDDSDDNEDLIGEDNTSQITVDLDYSLFSDTMLYDTIAMIQDGKSSAEGKTIKIRAEYGAYYDFNSNTFYNVIEKYDATACCAAYLELRFPDEIARPVLGSRIEIVGTVCDNGKYIDVTAMTIVSIPDNVSSASETKFDIDTTTLSVSELKSLIGEFGNIGNSYTGKTVRICGGYEMSKDGYSYLVGYQKNAIGSNVTSTWNIELHSDKVEFPSATTGYVNCYEIIGTISSYIEGGTKYACIEVETILPISTYAFS